MSPFPRVLLLAIGLAAALALAANPKAERDREFAAAAKLTPNVVRGARLFETCATCHGKDGRGTPDGEVPAIAGQHGSVLLKQLVDFRHDQRRDALMNFTANHNLSDAQDLTDVASYAANLPRFPATGTGIGDGSALGLGARVYFEACEECHGPLGQGDLRLARPRLAGQHYAYLLRQLDDTAHDRRPGMDKAHVARLRLLTPEQLRGVADYLSRVSPDLSSTQRH